MVVSWKTPTEGLSLSEKDVHIWGAALDLPSSSVQELKEKLSIGERIKAERLRFERDRRRFIVARGILRLMLGCYLSIEPGAVRFCYGRNGKPRLADTFGNGTIHFNQSHSEGLALYGFTRDREIGVDIEHVREFPEMEQVAEQVFSVRENSVFRALPKSYKKEAFFQIWTRKEAFIKGTGDGLSLPLDKFEVSLVPGEPASLLRIEDDSREASRWFIQGLKPAPNYVGAFAVKTDMFETKCWRWEVT